jgi:glycine/D-amino acid oxidase-like deaminating enzyme
VTAETPYWLDEPAADLSRRTLRGRAEVAVIGGGVTGCSCALTLAERGMRVRLYEQRRVAGGASGRNGGFGSRGAAMPYDVAREELGDAPARLIMSLTERSLDRLEGLAGDAFRRVGIVRLAVDVDEAEALRREHDALRADGFAVDWVDELPPPLDRLYHAAIVHPTGGALSPARWVSRLAQRAAEAGAEIVEGERVTVEEMDADAVVVCGDGFTASLLPELRGLVVATRGQMLATAPLPELRYVQPHGARHGYDYWQQLPDGRLLIGGNRDAALDQEDTDVEEPTPLIQKRIEALAEQLAGTRPVVTHRWAGIWGATPDRLPLVGPVPGRDRVWVAGGYSGHGNALGLACGDLVARALLGEDSEERRLFDPARLAGIA